MTWSRSLLKITRLPNTGTKMKFTVLQDIFYNSINNFDKPSQSVTKEENGVFFLEIDFSAVSDPPTHWIYEKKIDLNSLQIVSLIFLLKAMKNQKTIFPQNR